MASVGWEVDKTSSNERQNQDVRDAIAVVQKAAQANTFFDPAEAKTERVLLVQQLRTLTEAVVVAAVGEAETTNIAEAVDCRNTADFVAQNTTVAPSVVRADMKLAAWLRGFDKFADAFATGVITRHHIEEFRKADNDRTEGPMRAQQSMLIEHAATLSWRDFVVALRYWEIANDPDGEEPAEQERNNRVRARKHRDGTVSGNFHLDALAGAAFMQAFDTERERLRTADAETGTERNRRQRDLDAFMALITRGYARPNGTVPAPLVNIVLGHELAEQLLAGQPFKADPNDINRRCELIDGTPLHPTHAAAVLAIGQFRRHVFDAPNRIIETSRSRYFPKELRHLFHLESRGQCVVRGCDAPFAWLHADHRTPHSRGGPTSHANGQNLCGPHNRHKSDQ